MKKILLVDDKATIGRVLKIYLGTEYDLEYFENPLKALEWLNEGNIPDLIISDIHMPHMRQRIPVLSERKRAVQAHPRSDALQ